jgi:hypothetical protein
MRSYFLLTAALALAAPSRALAQTSQAPIIVTAPPVEDTITLDDGTVITGHISEVRLFESASITRSDGVTFIVPWSRIRGIAADSVTLRAPTVQPPPGTPPAVFSPTPNAPALPPVIEVTGWPPYDYYAPPPPIDLRVPGPGRVPLHVLMSNGESVDIGVATPAMHRRRQYAAEPASVLCRAPCTLYVPPGFFPLWIGRSNGRGTAIEIYVTGYGGAYEVTPTDERARNMGGLLIGLGVLGVLAGVAAEVALSAGSSPSSSTNGTPAIVGAGAGLLGIVVGSVVRARAAPRVRTVWPAVVSW